MSYHGVPGKRISTSCSFSGPSVSTLEHSQEAPPREHLVVKDQRARQTRIEEALVAARQVSQALGKLHAAIQAVDLGDPGAGSEMARARKTYNAQRDQLASIHDDMRPLLLGRYPAYKQRVGFFPARLDSMPGFGPAKMLENYRAVINSARNRAEDTVAFLEESLEGYRRSSLVTRLLWRVGWTSPGYSLYCYRRPASVAALVAVVAIVAGLVLGLTGRGADIDAGDLVTATTTAAASSAGTASSPTSTAPVSTTTSRPPLLDVAGDPREPAILQVVSEGIVQLQPDEQGRLYFRPGEYVERRQLLIWLDRVQPLPASDRDVPPEFYADLPEPLRGKAIDAYKSRIILEWPAEGQAVDFFPYRPVLARDAEAWSARFLVRLLPLEGLAQGLELSKVEAADYRSRISALKAEELDLVIEKFGLRPAGGFAQKNSVSRSEVAGMLVALMNSFEKYGG